MPRRTRAQPRRPFDVVLAATLHDPPGALANDLRRALPRLAAFYRRVLVATSPPTSPRMNALLAEAGMFAGTPPANQRGPFYRLAIRCALAAGPSHLHYLDLDRALRWVRRAPRELASVLRVARRHQVLVVGRTLAAHRSHHVPLYATETLANRLIAGRVGLAGRVDLLVPSFVLDRAAAATLLAGSRARDAAIYGEFAALLLRVAPEIAYIECRGLDWETPDRHRHTVRRWGLAAWRRRQETPAEWALRVDMARSFILGFERAASRRPGPAVSLRRLPARGA